MLCGPFSVYFYEDNSWQISKICSDGDTCSIEQRLVKDIFKIQVLSMIRKIKVIKNRFHVFFEAYEQPLPIFTAENRYTPCLVMYKP